MTVFQSTDFSLFIINNNSRLTVDSGKYFDLAKKKLTF